MRPTGGRQRVNCLHGVISVNRFKVCKPSPFHPDSRPLPSNFRIQSCFSPFTITTRPEAESTIWHVRRAVHTTNSLLHPACCREELSELTRQAFHTSHEFPPPPPPSPCQCLSSPFPLSKNSCVNENQTLSQILKGACLPYVILSSKAEKREKQILQGFYYVQLLRWFSIEFRKRAIFSRWLDRHSVTSVFLQLEDKHQRICTMRQSAFWLLSRFSASDPAKRLSRISKSVYRKENRKRNWLPADWNKIKTHKRFFLK